MADRTSFGKETTTDDVLEGVDLTGKLVLVTGASGGIGAETARALATAGASVTLAARNVSKAEGVAVEIRTSTGNPAVDVLELVLDQPDRVREAAKVYLAGHDKLHLLINNAGVMACPLERTAAGWEMQFATNHMGHFLFTCLLAPILRAAAPARIVNLSSAGHRFSGIVFDDIHYERRPYDKWEAYGQSKTANVLFSVELDRRLGADGVHAYAIHPGMIMTELARHMSQDDLKELGRRRPAGAKLEFKSIPAGAATSAYAATAPELEGRGGLYLEDCHVAGQRTADSQIGVLDYALDSELARRLWTVSEEALGESFDL
ncbi:MAG: SDR family NAD(P)-dependent oxidoreductase [Deltaproteobacteria bacterium]|nr:MAG: SDR family NAD(P)-dependent oxidoreductase [Deltaproteobacteria bacterium]